MHIKRRSDVRLLCAAATSSPIWGHSRIRHGEAGHHLSKHSQQSWNHIQSMDELSSARHWYGQPRREGQARNHPGRRPHAVPISSRRRSRRAAGCSPTPQPRNHDHLRLIVGRRPWAVLILCSDQADRFTEDDAAIARPARCARWSSSSPRASPISATPLRCGGRLPRAPTSAATPPPLAQAPTSW